MGAGPGVAEGDGAIEDEVIGFGIDGVDAEIAETFELESRGRRGCHGSGPGQPGELLRRHYVAGAELLRRESHVLDAFLTPVSATLR